MAQPEPIPLSREDRAILDVESETIAGHTCKVVVLGGPIEIDALRAAVAERLPSAPPLSSVLAETGSGPAWARAEEVDVARHVRGAATEPLTHNGLREEVARLFAERLDRSLPLWQMDVLALRGDGAAIVWRIHHALADGQTCMHLADAVLWDAEAEEHAPETGHPHPGHAEERRRRHIAAFIDHELGESVHRSPFDGQIGASRRVAFASVPLAPLHDAAKALGGATLNDAVLSITSGAIRHWIETHHGSLRGVRARVPVSLHGTGDDAGNRDSFFTIGLPLGEPDPVRRLAAVHRATAARKADHDADTMDELLRELNAHSPRLEHLCKRIEASPRRFALSVSNVPGPKRPLAVLDAPVTSVHSLAEIGARHALRVAVVSASGRLNFGFCADSELVPDLGQMATGVEQEAEALVGAVA